MRILLTLNTINKGMRILLTLNTLERNCFILQQFQRNCYILQQNFLLQQNSIAAKLFYIVYKL